MKWATGHSSMKNSVISGPHKAQTTWLRWLMAIARSTRIDMTTIQTANTLSGRYQISIPLQAKGPVWKKPATVPGTHVVPQIKMPAKPGPCLT